MFLNSEDIVNYKDKLLIYRIYNINSNKSYIGKCSKGLNRIKDHLNNWSNPKQDYRAKLLYRAMRKYGKEQFNYEILFIVHDETILSLSEIELIRSYQTLDKIFGYNLTSGGTGGFTTVNYNKKQLIEYKKKLSVGHKKFWSSDLSNERRKKSSILLSNIRKDPIKGLKNRKIASQRLKLLNKTDPRFINNKCKAVVCNETGIIYKSMKSAGEAHGVTGGAIQFAVANNTKCKNLTFKKIKND